MNIFNDEDYKHYLKMFLIGLGIFVCLALVFLFVFRQKYDIKLKTDTIDYGTSIKTSELVDTVAGNKVSNSNRISSNTITVNGYEITMNEINTFRLGKQKITCKYTDDSIDNQILYVNVVDKKKPVIHVNKSANTTLSLKNVRELNVDDLFSVNDNETPDTKIKIKKNIKEEKYSYGSLVHLIVKATDKSGNSASKSIPIQIKKKKKNVVNKAEDAQEEGAAKNEEQEKQESNSLSQQSNANQSSNQQYIQQQPVQTPQQQTTTPPVQQPVQKPKPSNKQYLFSQGYDMSTAPSACQSDLLSSGYTGSCTPIQDSSGIYLGMQLIFN